MTTISRLSYLKRIIESNTSSYARFTMAQRELKALGIKGNKEQILIQIDVAIQNLKSAGKVRPFEMDGQ